MTTNVAVPFSITNASHSGLPSKTVPLTVSAFWRAISVQKKSSTKNSVEDFPRKKRIQYYAPGDPAGVSVVPAGDSVVAAGASVAAGLVISVVSAAVAVGVAAAGAVVSVFCSHAPRSAALARMQMYFFIVGDAYCVN
jgi:hypothetical protein